MTELFTILKAIERLATEILISKNQTNSRLLPPFAGSAEDKQAVPNRKRNCSIEPIGHWRDRNASRKYLGAIRRHRADGEQQQNQCGPFQ